MFLFLLNIVMKELIAKIKQYNADIVKHYAANDKDAVLKTLEDIAPVLKELEEQQPETPSETENKVEKTLEEVTKTLEEVKKYADLYVSAENLQALKEELKNFTDGISEKISKLEQSVQAVTESEGDSQQQEEVQKTNNQKRW